MRIMEIIPCLQTGGAERFVVDLSNAFIRYGHEVILVTLFKKNDVTLLADLDSSVIVLNCGKSKGYDPSCYLKIQRIIKGYNPDVVHSHLGAIKYTAVSVLLRKKECVFFSTIHSDAKREAGNGLELLSRRLLFRNYRVIPVTISSETEKSFFDFYGFSGKMIENGASPSDTTFNSELYKEYHADVDLLLVNIARINKVKNQRLLIQAIEALNDSGMNIRLLLIGRLDSDDNLMEFIDRHSSDHIMYLGERDNPRDYMCISDAFCLSSIQEGMPITVIEAFSVGCPVISTPVGGCKNMIIDGMNGYLASNVSVSALACAIKRFSELDSESRSLMSFNCRKQFEERFSIDICASNYISLFEDRQYKNKESN